MNLESAQAPIVSLPDWLSIHAERRPRRVALQSDHRAITYGELHAAATSMAARAFALGVRPGHRVGVMCHQGLLHALCLHALMLLRAVLVPLNWRLQPTELAYQLEDSGASFVLCDESAAPLASQVADAVSRPVQTVVVSERAWEAEASTGAFSVPPVDVSLTSVHAIVYTSGTTGRPKGAMITYQNHWYSAMASVLQFGLDPDEHWLVPMPLFHVGGMGVLMRSLIYGTTAVVHDRFDAERVDRALASGEITLVSLVPTMLARLLKLRRGPYPSRLRAMLMGGAGCPRPVLERALELGLPVAQSYGLTETNTQVATIDLADALRKMGSSGRPLANTRIAVQGPNGPTTAPGVEGEILVQGPTVFAGYYNRKEETERALSGGWLHTGDIGRFDEDGFLYVLDRRADLIVSGGENVYPAEIESQMLALPGVVDAGVVGKPDDEWGQVPVAFVVLEPGKVLTDEMARALREELRARLAHYKVPAEIRQVDALPRTASGKLMRYEMRKWVMQG
ncbi:o-succinylbenzoate--CoA ligase [Alicyclobacillus sendaiensis]|uniref:2-succinylbenzoate--CoA ligase n=1 Tax=Alicyclobacillus sendaiensis PA2 TaxID=3029425 RepID=A0ABT6XVY5_ALISE|nr:o-succinylbenzoate--CoA ligase [Alicyclobacillus sendaiensis]MDI9259255.1 o-succinylbenzoate--CoA ligase [Alicyclobacillus sendaiensis PA2]